jgi:uncharacterized protein (TIGR01244 family)
MAATTEDSRNDGMTSIESIPSFVALSDRLATAGQPSEDQLAAVAASGFQLVINLGLHDDPSYSLRDEAGRVASLGLDYVHIPVRFAAPGLDALAEFSAAMAHAGHAKVFVHCRHNKRVPVFVALDRVLRQGWDPDEAFAVMRSTWVPDATWQAFIDGALAR